MDDYFNGDELNMEMMFAARIGLNLNAARIDLMPSNPEYSSEMPASRRRKRREVRGGRGDPWGGRGGWRDEMFEGESIDVVNDY